MWLSFSGAEVKKSHGPAPSGGGRRAWVLNLHAGYVHMSMVGVM